jgi:hypothetical protein
MKLQEIRALLISDEKVVHVHILNPEACSNAEGLLESDARFLADLASFGEDVLASNADATKLDIAPDNVGTIFPAEGDITAAPSTEMNAATAAAQPHLVRGTDPPPQPYQGAVHEAAPAPAIATEAEVSEAAAPAEAAAGEAHGSD